MLNETSMLVQITESVYMIKFDCRGANCRMNKRCKRYISSVIPPINFRAEFLNLIFKVIMTIRRTNKIMEAD